QVDFLLVQVALVTTPDEVDPKRLVPGRLPPGCCRNLLVAIGQPAHEYAEPVRLGVPFFPGGYAEYRIIDVGLGAWRNHSHDIDRAQKRNGRILSSLDQRNGLRNDVVVDFLP